MGFGDKTILYRMISCPIDVKDRKVVKQWLEYCMNYPADAYLDPPKLDGRKKRILGRADMDSEDAKSRSNRLTMQNYETYYKKLDLYYQFSYRFDKVIDEKWLAGEREKTEAIIMRYLSKGKKGYIARCQYCGRLLPVGNMAGKCRRCSERKG